MSNLPPIENAPTAFYLKNLSSLSVTRGVQPWDFVPEAPGIPEEARKNKKFREAWITTPATCHHVYSFNEGLNQNLRISRPRNDGGGNPIHATHALIADYDSAQPEEKVLAYAKEMPFVPNYLERTLSGNWRYIFLLGTPILHPSFDFAKHFFKTFPDFAFDLSRGCPGFDKKAFESPERLWTNGCHWIKLHDDPIPADVVTGWVVKAGATYCFSQKEFGTAIPLDVLKPELAKRYPRFASWPGEFTLNSQGPTFWIDESTSPKSAIVRETGIQTFAAHAPKGFYSWADLLGIDFVMEYEAASIGRAVADIYYDGRHYWRRVLDQSWQPFEKSDLILHLRTSRGVTSKADKSSVSGIDRALEHIQNAQRVAGATPFLYRPAGIVTRYGKKYLNTSNIRVLAPAEGKAIWGPSGQFPWLSQFWRIWIDETTGEVVMSWVSHFYKHAHNLETASGHGLFIAGPVAVGKTLFSRGILARLFGGMAEAGDFLTGVDNFNSELFEAPIWVIDDGSVSSDLRAKRRWDENIKRAIANGTFRNNGKFIKAVTSEWQGRVVVTLNADEESMAILPDTDLSNHEKLILVRTADTPPHDYPSNAEIERILEQELPWFARWLLDYEIPEHRRSESRFGIKQYADKTLLDTSRRSSRVAGFSDILDDWKDYYFKEAKPEAPYWEGTPYQLHKEILRDSSAEVAMRPFTVDAIGRHLSKLKKKGAPIDAIIKGEQLLWRIHRNKPQPSNAA